MKITMEPTVVFTRVDGVMVRAWKGVTTDGVECVVFVVRVAVPADRSAEFDRELIETGSWPHHSKRGE